MDLVQYQYNVRRLQFFSALSGIDASLRCQLLGQVPWLVGVVAELNGQVEGQSLQWQDAKQCRQGSSRPLDEEDAVVRQFDEPLPRGWIFDIGDHDGQDVRFGNEELDVSEHLLLIWLLVRDDEDDRGLRVRLEVGEEVIRQLLNIDILTMHIRQLLHLECCFLRDHGAEASAAEEDVLRGLEERCDLLRLLLDALERQFEIGGEHLELVHDTLSDLLRTVEVFVLGEPDGDECQGRHLADEGLGTGHRELAAAVKEHADVVLSRKRRVVFVHDVDPREAMLLRESERNQQIHGLTTLRDAEEAAVLPREVSL